MNIKRLKNLSPLRYPGGKNSLAGVLEALIYANEMQGGTYIEPFAGGAAAGLSLLRDGHVESMILNDRDPAIYSFWRSVMKRPEELVDRILTAELSIAEWQRQRAIYRSPSNQSMINLGFAAFYLNRCNRSGIIKNAGPIGGIAQAGKWKISARFNRDDLARRVNEVSAFGEKITVTQYDARGLLSRLDKLCDGARRFIYADPPYYKKGRELYLNHFVEKDHAAFAKEIQTYKTVPWIVTYDDVPEVRALYSGSAIYSYDLRYSAHHSSKNGGEIMICPPALNVPFDVVLNLPLGEGKLEPAKLAA